MYRKTSIVILILGLILATVAGGCLSPISRGPSETDDLPPLGLGLEIPASHPPPGPFVEGTGLIDLEQFFRREASGIFVECGNLDAEDRAIDFIEQERYSLAIDELFFACATEDYREVVDEAIRDGTEAQLYGHWVGEARTAIQQTRTAVNDHAGPGNAIELTLLSYLMGWIAKETSITEQLAPSFWEHYASNASRDELQLRAVFMNLVRPVERIEVVVKILERYPWTSPPCRMSDQEIDAIAGRVQSNVDRSLELANLYGHDELDSDGFPNLQYSLLIKGLIPELETAREDRWWPRLLFLEADSLARLTYWESFSDPAWPTLEEAEFLLAQHRNLSRSIWTEDELVGFIGYFEGRMRPPFLDWETDVESGPPYFLGKLAVYSPLQDFDCNPES